MEPSTQISVHNLNSSRTNFSKDLFLSVLVLMVKYSPCFTVGMGRLERLVEGDGADGDGAEGVSADGTRDEGVGNVMFV